MNFFGNLPELARHELKINYAIGNFFISVNDYTQCDILKNFVVSREYNSLSAKWKFNIEGRPKKIILDTSREIFLTYEGDNLISVKDEIGRVTRYEYSENLLARVIYPDGSMVKYFYDHDRNLISCTGRDGKIIFQNEYDDLGRITRMNDRTFFYDDQNRELVENGESVIIYRHNHKKLLEKIIYSDDTFENFIYDANDNLNYKLGRDGGEHFWRYNDGLLRNEIFPDGEIKKFEYDERGNITKIIDSLGHEEKYFYSSKNLLIATEKVLNKKEKRIEKIERDFIGRILRREINGNVTNYVYDENSPVPALEKTPCGYKFNYRYDKVFRLLAVKTEVGEFSFAYNPLNEVAEKKNIFAEVERPEKNFEKFDFEIHDIGGRLIEARKKIGEEFQLIRRKYDSNDNCIERREWKDLQDEHSATGKVFVTRFEYDGQNRLTRKIVGKNFVEYGYDCLNRCIREKICEQGKPTRIKRFSYDLDGKIISTKEYEVK